MSGPQSSVLSPQDALTSLASRLREDEVIAPHVVDASEEPVLGLLVAAGPRAATAPAEYALVVEAVREGYLLHYGRPRLLSGHDADLALLAGDYLYALGLERLAAQDDLDAVRELSDLISLSAEVHAESADPAAATRQAGALWLATVMSVGAGASPDAEAAKAALRAGDDGAATELGAIATKSAASEGLARHISQAAEAIGFDSS